MSAANILGQARNAAGWKQTSIGGGSQMVNGMQRRTVTEYTKVVSITDPSVETGLPNSRADIAVPYLIGRRKTSSPNTIYCSTPVTTTNIMLTDTTTTYINDVRAWNISAIPQKAGVSHSGIAYTVGGGTILNESIEEYQILSTVSHVTFALGICLGPDVHLVGIYDDNGNKLYNGALEGTPTGEPLTVANYNQIVGARTKAIYFYPGSFTQPKDRRITQDVGDSYCSAFRGTSYIVFDTTEIDSSGDKAIPYTFDVYRTPDPLGLGAANYNQDRDVNIATAMYDILTSDWSMFGIGPEYIDHDTFYAAGLLLAVENNFCTVWATGQVSGKSMLNGLEVQARGKLRWNPVIKKVQLILFREGYDTDTLPLFTPENCMSVDNLSREHWINLPRALKLSFPDRGRDYGTNYAYMGLNKSSEEYINRVSDLSLETVSRGDIAAAVAGQIYAKMASPIMTADLQVNRDGADKLPGDLIALEYPKYFTGKVPFRVTRVKEQGNKLDTVTLSVEQAYSVIRDLSFGKPDTLAPDLSPDMTPPLLTTRGLPLWFAKQRVTTVSDWAANNTYFFAQPTSGADYFVLYDLPNMETQLLQLGKKVPGGTLGTALTDTTGYANGFITALTISFPAGAKRPEPTNYVGTSGGQDTYAPATFAESLLQIGSEIFSYGSMTSVAWDENTFIFLYVRRGLFDTIERNHAVGASVLFFGDLSNVLNAGFDANSGLTYTVAVIPSNGVTEGVDAGTASLLSYKRAILPACPDMVSVHPTYTYPTSRVDGYGVTKGSKYFVSYNRRDYKISDADGYSGDNPPGDGTTYTIRLVTGTTTVVLASGVADAYSEVTIPSDAATGAARITVQAVHANGNSLMTAFATVTIT